VPAVLDHTNCIFLIFKRFQNIRNLDFVFVFQGTLEVSSHPNKAWGETRNPQKIFGGSLKKLS
jgi:hypothetical protein